MIILMGVAGAGKSMQGRLLADERGYAWISTGEILRVLITGKRRQEMLEGKLLSDAEMIGVMDKVFELIDITEEFILDGFPRTVVQAKWLMRQVDAGRLKLTAIVHLEASEAVVRDRLLQRGRVDDSESAITQRFNEYRAVTLPILEHLKHKGVPICTINASQTPRNVHDELTRYIDKAIVA